MQKLLAIIAILFVCTLAGKTQPPPPQPVPTPVTSLPVGIDQLTISGSGGNAVTCTTVRPWLTVKPSSPLPIIAWGNGWAGGSTAGVDVTRGYLPGLTNWSLNVNAIVIAANERSVTAAKIKACVDFLIGLGNAASGTYSGTVDATRIGYAGHSQGGGEAVQGSAVGSNTLAIKGTVAMAPYVGSWNNLALPKAPIFMLSGTADTVIVPGSWDPYWQRVKVGTVGGIKGLVLNGTHDSDAWGAYPDGTTMSIDDAARENFGRYQVVTENFWRKVLYSNTLAGSTLKTALQINPPWSVVELAEVAGSFVL